MAMLRVVLISALMASGVTEAHADILPLPGGGLAVTKSTLSVPRGISQQEVLTLLGEPEQRFDPVGSPAISSWAYDRFRVYFEDGKVLHTVISAP